MILLMDSLVWQEMAEQRLEQAKGLCRAIIRGYLRSKRSAPIRGPLREMVQISASILGSTVPLKASWLMALPVISQAKINLSGNSVRISTLNSFISPLLDPRRDCGWGSFLCAPLMVAHLNPQPIPVLTVSKVRPHV